VTLNRRQERENEWVHGGLATESIREEKGRALRGWWRAAVDDGRTESN